MPWVEKLAKIHFFFLGLSKNFLLGVVFDSIEYMNNGQFFIDIARAGIGLSIGGRPEHVVRLLVVLLDLEVALDKGRGLVFDSPEFRTEINTLMDALRKRIRDILDTMDGNEVARILEERGESLKRQFSISR
ncbi:MAG: hypothetical protein HZA35_01670 [Parcubacteria group bacterium]|nr:hypothetical protein [Parcubacteria group bacterium]